jgi:hypothetical protein
VIGCDRNPAPTQSHAPAEDAAPRTAGKPVSSLGAFELSLLGEGALLVWAEEAAQRRGIYAQRLDAQGKIRGAAVRVTPAKIEPGAKLMPIVSRPSRC